MATKYKPTREEILADAKAVYENHGALTKETYRAYGRFTYYWLKSIGGIEGVCRELGIPGFVEPTREELIADLQRLNEDYGQVTQRIINEHGRFKCAAVRGEFGTLENAYKAAGVKYCPRQPKKPRSVSSDQIVADAKRVYADYGYITKALYLKEGKYSNNTVRRNFGSFNGLWKACGFDLNCEIDIPDEALLEEARRIYLETGELTKADVERLGKYSPEIYHRRFGGLTKVCELIGVDPTFWRNASDEELLEELRRMYREYGSVSKAVISENGKWSEAVYYRRFGTLEEAYKRAGIPNTAREKSPYAQMLLRQISSILDCGYETEHTWPWLINPKTGRNLYVDGYYPKYRLVVEINGRQHYEEMDQWLEERPSNTLETRQWRDKVKAELLEEHGFKLLVIDPSSERNRAGLIKMLAPLL